MSPRRKSYVASHSPALSFASPLTYMVSCVLQYKWWEQEKQDNSVKWNSLVHAGVLFPPPYEPLPKNIKMKYDGQSPVSSCLLRGHRPSLTSLLDVFVIPGKALTLPPRSEEVAGFFAAMIETDHAKDTTFQANFFRDFKHHLDLFPPVRPDPRLASAPVAV